MPPVAELRQAIGGVMTLGRTMPTVWTVVANGTINLSPQWAVSNPILSACMTPQATSGNGRVRNGKPILMAVKAIVRSLMPRRVVCRGAVRGATIRCSRAHPPASGPTQSTVPTMSVCVFCVLPGLINPLPFIVGGTAVRVLMRLPGMLAVGCPFFRRGEEPALLALLRGNRLQGKLLTWRVKLRLALTTNPAYVQRREEGISASCVAGRFVEQQYGVLAPVRPQQEQHRQPKQQCGISRVAFSQSALGVRVRLPTVRRSVR